MIFGSRLSVLIGMAVGVTAAYATNRTLDADRPRSTAFNRVIDGMHVGVGDIERIEIIDGQEYATVTIDGVRGRGVLRHDNDGGAVILGWRPFAKVTRSTTIAPS